MENNIKPKWDIADAIKNGDETYALTIKYRQDIEPRLKPDEIPQFKLQIDGLAKRRPEQEENLITQKSKTKGQDEIVNEVRGDVVSVRNLVRTNNPTEEISKAYGVGEKINNNVTSVTAAADLVIKAYGENTEWSKNEAGILEEDIDEIKDEILLLDTAAGIQDSSMTTRKEGTMDKNVLQRMVENEITRISAIGLHVFRKKDPSVALLFGNLIPNSSKQKPTKTETVPKP